MVFFKEQHENKTKKKNFVPQGSFLVTLVYYSRWLRDYVLRN